MIGKLKKGCSFGGCVRYVTGKDEAKILASDGVLLGTNAEMTQSFELQRQLNPRIKKPVGHIALSFKPEDKPRLTDDFMAKIALEYMQMMGITKTQFIIVRHHNTDNPHCHIVYNRINNEGKLISDRNDYRRNEQVTKALKSKYGLTYGTDKSGMDTEQFCDSLFKFLLLVEKAYKQKPLIYTGANFYDHYLLGKLDSYKLMIAQYTKRTPVLKDGRDFEMWQYTGKGRLNGVNGYVDKSRFMGNHRLREIRFRHR